MIALPLSELTVGLIGASELVVMKRDAVLVDVARAEIVDEEALCGHLLKFPQFTYARTFGKSRGGRIPSHQSFHY